MIAYRVSGYSPWRLTAPTIEKVDVLKMTEHRVFIKKKTWEKKVAFGPDNPHTWFDDKEEAVEFFINQIQKAEYRLEVAMAAVKKNKFQFREI
jgi:hypothetical protein